MAGFPHFAQTCRPAAIELNAACLWCVAACSVLAFNVSDTQSTTLAVPNLNKRKRRVGRVGELLFGQRPTQLRTRHSTAVGFGRAPCKGPCTNQPMCMRMRTHYRDMCRLVSTQLTATTDLDSQHTKINCVQARTTRGCDRGCDR